MKRFHVYIMASKSRTLYTGVTSHIERRVIEHKRCEIEGFTQRYRCDRLVYAEEASSALEAITREKHIKGWRREKEVALIESMNPTWDDLAEAWVVG